MIHILGHEEYGINMRGEIINYKTGKAKKAFVNFNGYYRVELWKNNKKYRYYLHSLIAITFIPNPKNKPCVNHIDGNRLNNNISNLEWVTYSENVQHAYDTKLRLPIKHSIETKLKLREINLGKKLSTETKAKMKINRGKKVISEDGRIFNSATDAALSLGLSIKSVSNSIQNNYKCGGTKWKYL